MTLLIIAAMKLKIKFLATLTQNMKLLIVAAIKLKVLATLL